MSGDREAKERRATFELAILSFSLAVAVIFLLSAKPALAAVSMAAGASLSCAAVAFRFRAPVWLTLSVCAGAMSINTTLNQYRQPDGSWIDHVPAVTLALCALTAAIACWLGVRPFLADAKARPYALVAAPALSLCVIGILIQDAAFNASVDRTVTLVGTILIAVGFPVAAVGIALITGDLWRHRRTAEVVLLIGALAHGLAHITALLVQDARGIWLAMSMSTGSMLIAAALSSSRAVAQPLVNGQHALSVRIWPAWITGLTAIAAWAFYRFPGDTQSSVGVLAVTIAVIAAIFAGRELAGPRKPLVLPFSRADRSLQQLPHQLLRGSVRLVGRPVRRGSDGSIVGIEAEAAWSNLDSQTMTLADAASAAGLDGWLQEVTLASAHAHLPAVLNNLDGDDPFLSVPFNPAVGSTPPPSGDELNGLLLRTDVGGDSLLPWQNRGAMVQALASHLSVDTEAIVDIVAVRPGDPVPATAMALLRTNAASSESTASRRLMFVLDEDQQPTDLAVILSPVDNTESALGTVRPV